MKITGKQPIKTIVKKLPQLDTEQKKTISDVVNNLSSNNIVSLDTKEILYKKSSKTFAVKFLNYVEPYLIKGQRYTLFYTDIDHNLRIGDRVFIVGGNYDSDVLIQNNKFNKLSDGYTVQYVDKTKIVLDIEYTGVLPWIDDDIDSFIKVYVASNQEEFDYFIQTCSSGYFDYLTNRFAYSGTQSNNNLLYINGTFSLSGTEFGIFGFTNSGSYSLTYSNSFLILDGTFSGYLQDVTSDVMSGSYSTYVNNDRLFIINGDFENQDVKFKNDYIYYFDISNWKVDRKYFQPFISEQNFRNGVFKKGEFNQGLFGTHQETINYSGSDIDFTLGTVLNTTWHTGNIGKGEGNEQSYFTSFDEFGLPSVKENTKNNAGLGYNFFYDSIIYNSVIDNGTFDNNIIGTFSYDLILENYLLSNNSTYSVSIKSGNYFNNIIENSSIINSSLFTSLIKNSFVNNTKSGNSEFEKTLFLESKYTTDKVVKIRAYDEFFINWYDSSLLDRYKVYKFYIDSESYDRLKHFKNFYIDGLNIDKSGVGILNFFDDKYTIDSYHSSYDEITGKLLRKYIVQLSTVEENKKIVSGLNNTLVDNPNYGLASIDIIVKSYEDFNNQILPLPLDIYSFNISTIESESSWGASPSSVIFELSTGTFSVDGITSSQGLYDGLILLNYGTWTYSGSLFTVNSTFSYIEFTYYNPIDDINVGPIIISQSFGETISQIGNTVDITSAYILDSDFKSGLFKSSEWITGNNISYNRDNSFNTTNGHYTSTLDSNRNLSLTVPNSTRKLLLDTGDITFVNGLYYDTSLNGGDNLVKLNDIFKINSVSSGSIRTFVLSDFINGTSSVLWNVPIYSSQTYLTTKNAENVYNYLHSVKFESSKIKSGIFRRSYFVDCDINNTLFNLSEKEPQNFNNWRSLLVSDVLFSDNNNKINSGLVANSSFIAGSDTWNNGIFYNSIWNTDTFTWSFAATSSEINSTFNNKFKNGIFRESRWVNGTFENGNFYKNRSNIVFTASVYSDLSNAYYREGCLSRYSWLNGTFENGIFEQSNFENGTFKNGEFYNSTFLDGIATGGDFGRRNVKFPLTRVAGGTFSSVNVVSAEFRSENPTGEISGNIEINWLSGIFNNGLFGVKIDSGSYSVSGLSYSFKSNWYDGTFNNGDFTDIASWKGGKFFGGKFTSYYGYPFVTADDYITAASSSFAWQDGEFNGGEFGNASTGTNSTWYSGEFNGGIFTGRYWNNGIFTRGVFIGSGTGSTTLSNIPLYSSKFTKDFFGLWNTGIVSENKDTFVKNKKIFTKLEREFNKKKKNRAVELDNVYWRSGTFSHSDGVMNNSVWKGGAFEKGRFKNSSFNPYINYIINGNFDILQSTSGDLNNWSLNYSDYNNNLPIGATFSTGIDTNNINKFLLFSGTSSVSKLFQLTGVVPGYTYKLRITLNENINNQLRFGSYTKELRNRNFTEGYNNWVIAATSQSGGTLPDFQIFTASPGYATFSDTTGATGSAYLIYPDLFKVGDQYLIKFYGQSANMGTPQIGSCISSDVQIENGILMTSFTDGINLTYSIITQNNNIYQAFITAQYPDFILNWTTNGNNSSFIVSAFEITSNSAITSTDITQRTTFTQVFTADSSELAFEFIPKINSSGGSFSWSGSTCSIRSIEIVSGDGDPIVYSGFNVDKSCYWDNGTFEDSEFYFSKWNNGRWISGTAAGMIWKNGVADYMNAYNVHWEGGIWRNGNWNGAPFNYNNLSLDTCFYTYFDFKDPSNIGANFNIGSPNFPPFTSATVSSTSYSEGFKIEYIDIEPNWDYRESQLDFNVPSYVNTNGSFFIKIKLIKPFSVFDYFNPISSYRITLIFGTISIANYEDINNKSGSFIFSIGSPGDTNTILGTNSTPLNGSIYANQFTNATQFDNISNYYDVKDLVGNNGIQNPSGPITNVDSYLATIGGSVSQILTPAFSTNDLYINFNIWGIEEIYVDKIIVERQICNITPSINLGYESDIIANISKYRNEISDIEYPTIFINNAFTSSVDTNYTGINLSNNGDLIPTSFTQSPPNRWSFTTTEGGEFSTTFSNSDLRALNNSNSINIFTQSGNYDIEVKYRMTYLELGSFPPSSEVVNSKFELRIANSTETIEDNIPISSFWNDKIGSVQKTFTKTITLPNVPNIKTFIIKKLNSILNRDQFLTLKILSAKVTKKEYLYDSNYNNQLTTITLSTIDFDKPILFPNFEYKGGSSLNNNIISTKFGNGIFRSGTASAFSSVWENGVWNDGWRYDPYVVLFNNFDIFSGTNKSFAFSGNIDIKSNKIGTIPSLIDRNLTTINNSLNKWIISLRKSDSIVKYQNLSQYSEFNQQISLNTLFKVGDIVSVGNIIGIDLNDNRKLIKNSFKIINVDDESILLQVDINFPIRSILKDSEEHPIYVSKNIWLSGAFLNGTFKGIWNYGLFKGRPFITRMVDSQWIDGIFDGGNFRGKTASVDDSNNVNVLPSGLIQNFIFKDNNLGNANSPSIKNFAIYNSWIDVNHFNTSMTNIYRDSIGFDDNIFSEKGVLNLNGYPTKDILSSISTFKNLYDDEFKDYSLGWKYKKYDDFIQNPFFNYPVDSRKAFVTGIFNPSVPNLVESFDIGATYSIPGMFEFVNKNSWRTNVITPMSSGFTFASFISSNTSVSNLDILRITSDTSSRPILLDNDDTRRINRFRYSIIEFEMDYKIDQNSQVLNQFKYPYLLNEPQSRYFQTEDRYEYISSVPDFIGHNQNSEKIKREYFYNRPSLQMVLAPTLFFYDIFAAYFGGNGGRGLYFTGSNLPLGLTTGNSIFINKFDNTINTGANGYQLIGDIQYSQGTNLPLQSPTNPPSEMIAKINVTFVDSKSGQDGGIAFIFGSYSADFKYIKMYEVDAIPFFYYADQDRIVKIPQAPFYAVSPQIDYNDSDFSFIDNLSISETIFDTIENPPTNSVGNVIISGQINANTVDISRNNAISINNINIVRIQSSAQVVNIPNFQFNWTGGSTFFSNETAAFNSYQSYNGGSYTTITNPPAVGDILKLTNGQSVNGNSNWITISDSNDPGIILYTLQVSSSGEILNVIIGQP